MVSRLYKIKKTDVDSIKEERYFNRSDFINPNKYSNCCCVKRQRDQLGIAKARLLMDKEINIIEIIKSLRYLKNSIHLLIPKKKRFELKERSRYFCIDPDEKGQIDVKNF